MLQSDFSELQLYANKYQLPHRRNELLLAQLAQFIAAANGAKVEALDAYMPYRAALDDVDFDNMTPEEIRAYYDFEPDT